jgi:NtrC-family two-component system response regulator AlgB
MPDFLVMEFLVLDDDKTFREASCFLIESEGHQSEGASNGEEALRRLSEDKFDVVLVDLHLGKDSGLALLPEIQRCCPEAAVVAISAQGTVPSAVEAMRLGAVDFLEKPFLREQFHTVLARVQRFRKLGQRIATLEQEVTETRAAQGEPVFDFAVPAMREVMNVVERAASTPASILILGESGTGKSVLARAIHQRSHLAEKPLVTVSCPSLSRELLESDLFGHVKGAFTGALRDHWGKVKAADGGTLFLDEIGDLPPEVQPKLLRLLQEREYERLGENVTRRADVRIIAATNQDLMKRVAEGLFREDLYFRLNVIALVMPPLRERQGDFARFAQHYLNHFAEEGGRRLAGFSGDAMDCLLAHRWPGNLRELRNVIERAVILARSDRVAPDDLPAELRRTGSGANEDRTRVGTDPGPILTGARVSLERLEEDHLRRVLASTRSLTEAAGVLGIDQATLYRKRKRLGLDEAATARSSRSTTDAPGSPTS